MPLLEVGTNSPKNSNHVRYAIHKGPYGVLCVFECITIDIIDPSRFRLVLDGMNSGIKNRLAGRLIDRSQPTLSQQSNSTYIADSNGEEGKPPP